MKRGAPARLMATALLLSGVACGGDDDASQSSDTRAATPTATVAPTIMATGSFVMFHKKPSAIPGNTACDIVSPTNAIRLTTTNPPNNPQFNPSNKQPNKTTRKPLS